MKQRLDKYLFASGFVSSRSQAESFIKLGKVEVDGVVIRKSGYFVGDSAKIRLLEDQPLVSRAGHKLAGAAKRFNLNFFDKIVLDVGSSTGGFTDYVLKSGARKVIAVDVGTNQLHESLRSDERIELNEKTDIRELDSLTDVPDFVVIDVSFISLKLILPHVARLIDQSTCVVAMCKPQFEAGAHQTNKGIIKNSAQRRTILKDFETWLKPKFLTLNKADSDVAGAGGNVERFYLLKKLS